MMEQIMNYVQPELIVVAIVLYFCGMGLKQTQTIKDKYIPLILGCFWHRPLWDLGSGNVSTGERSGDCNGYIYGNRSGNFNGGPQYLCESNY